MQENLSDLAIMRILRILTKNIWRIKNLGHACLKASRTEIRMNVKY